MATALAMRGEGRGNGYGDGYGNGNGNGEAFFVRSGSIIVCLVVIHSRCMQHRHDARIFSKVLKMLLLLASSFSWVLVRTAAFVNGNEEGWR